MATLQRIRNRAGLLIGALGLALLAFILGDLLTSGGAWVNKFKDKAFVVDGEVVSTGAYQNRVLQFEEFQKFMSGQNSLNENISSQIREFVYEQMVKEMMLDEEASKLGLAVTKAEMNDMVYGENISPILMQSPLFMDPQTRQFNRQGLLEFISYIQTDINTVPDEQKQQLYSFQQQWQVIENMMKYQRLEEKYNTLLAAMVKSNNAEAKASYEDSKTSSEIAYTVTRYTSIPDSTVSVSNSEIEKLYKERKNNYKTDMDTRKITYFARDIQPSQEDFNVVENEMQRIRGELLTSANPALLVADYSEVPYQDIFFAESALDTEEKNFVESASIGEVFGPVKDENVYRLYKLMDKTVAPDSVNIRMIVVPQNTAENNMADSLLNVIRGGKNFADVANELNPQANGGEVGWVNEAMLASAGEEFVNSVFKASKGEILELNLRGFTQIVKVEDITRPVQKYKLAVIQMPVVISDKTVNDIDNELNQFVAENGNADNLYQAATDKGYNVIRDYSIVPNNIGLPQINGSRQVIHWAFNEKVGSVKKFDLAEQRLVAAVTSETKAGYTPVSDVADVLKDELIKDKKAEKIIADLKAKNVNNLDAYADIMGGRIDTTRFVKFSTPSITGVGREPAFNVFAKYGAVNSTEGPVKGNSGVYVMSLNSRTEDGGEYNSEMIRQNLDRTYQFRFNNTSVLFNILKEKLDVEDNRIKFF